VRAHLSGPDDALAVVRPILDRVDNFAELIETDPYDATFASLPSAEMTGRPLGTADFVADLERRLGRPIAKRAPERKPGRPIGEQQALFS
jgi:hypothetical protein